MEFDPEDRKIVELLTKVKTVNGGYPPEMFESRRQSYLKSIAGIGLGVGIGIGPKDAINNGNGAGGFHVTASKLLEAVLVVAIIAEAGALAYFYRDKLADIFQTFSTTSSIQEVTSPPVIMSPLPELQISETSASAVPTGTITLLPSGTPIPGLSGDPNINNNGNNAGGVTPADSTPAPNGNNGNHYGQTPKPERTKENNNDNNNNNNEPPKGNKGK